MHPNCWTQKSLKSNSFKICAEKHLPVSTWFSVGFLWLSPVMPSRVLRLMLPTSYSRWVEGHRNIGVFSVQWQGWRSSLLEYARLYLNLLSEHCFSLQRYSGKACENWWHFPFFMKSFTESRSPSHSFHSLRAK